jgi:hypothetical protein
VQSTARARGTARDSAPDAFGEHAELAAAPEGQQPLLHPNLAEIYRQKVAALAEALADETMQDEGFELIRSLLDEIVLVPEGEELRIEIHGELAGILELCQPGKTPGRGRASAEQIKVVAGAGFGLCALFIAPGLERLARRVGRLSGTATAKIQPRSRPFERSAYCTENSNRRPEPLATIGMRGTFVTVATRPDALIRGD